MGGNSQAPPGLGRAIGRGWPWPKYGGRFQTHCSWNLTIGVSQLYGPCSSLFPEQVSHLISKDGDGFAVRRKGQRDLALALQGGGIGENMYNKKKGPKI